MWVEKYRRSYGKRLELAIWYNGTTLCGLALGKASGANIHVRLEVLEGAPGKSNTLKGSVAFIALTAFELYGSVCGSEEARIIDPVDGAIRVYEKFGYKLMPSSKSHPRYLMNKPNSNKAPSVAEFERGVKKQVQKLKKQKKAVLGSEEPSGKINKSDMDY